MVGQSGGKRSVMYKCRGIFAPDIESRRKRLAAEQREERGKRRNDAFAARRDIHDDEPAGRCREKKLEEWRKKKNKEMSNKMKTWKKSPFVVGKITYNDSHLYRLPESTMFQVPKGVPVQTLLPMRTLRSHTREVKQRPIKSVQETINDFTSAMASTAIKDKERIIENQPKNIAELLNKTFDEPQLAALSEIQPNIFKRASPESKSHTSRNKASLFGANDFSAVPETSEVCAVNEKHILQSAEENSADHFRSLYNWAVAKLNRLCENWTLQLEDELPDSIIDEINVAVGYAKLLISQKLQQFEDLISEHENMHCSTELKVLSNDLDGFWNMVNYQVEDIYKKFTRLETLKQNNWQETVEKYLPMKQLTENCVQKPKISKAKGTSGLRTFLAQARNNARMCKDENRNPSVGAFNEQIAEKPRPMSPIVIRVTSRAKFLGSPKTPCAEARSPLHNLQPVHGENLPETSLAKVRSPFHIIQPESAMTVLQTPQIPKKTPALKLKSKETPGSTPQRRSMRILHRKQI